ncbi:uncharacterized protein [Panulirus ornatus]|uniref:uncharacterized protein n=1 Tax=Panulirus ornatus TaxID=150431 RepID=UPI003A879C52
MESVLGRVVVMVVVGIVGGTVAILLVRSEARHRSTTGRADEGEPRRLQGTTTTRPQAARVVQNDFNYPDVRQTVADDVPGVALDPLIGQREPQAWHTSDHTSQPQTGTLVTSRQADQLQHEVDFFDVIIRGLRRRLLSHPDDTERVVQDDDPGEQDDFGHSGVGGERGVRSESEGEVGGKRYEEVGGRHRLRHPRRKVHHRGFDHMFPGSGRELRGGPGPGSRDGEGTWARTPDPSQGRDGDPGAPLEPSRWMEGPRSPTVHRRGRESPIVVSPSSWATPSNTSAYLPPATAPETSLTTSAETTAASGGNIVSRNTTDSVVSARSDAPATGTFVSARSDAPATGTFVSARSDAPAADTIFSIKSGPDTNVSSKKKSHTIVSTRNNSDSLVSTKSEAPAVDTSSRSWDPRDSIERGLGVAAEVREAVLLAVPLSLLLTLLLLLCVACCCCRCRTRHDPDDDDDEDLLTHDHQEEWTPLGLGVCEACLPDISYQVHVAKKTRNPRKRRPDYTELVVEEDPGSGRGSHGLTCHPPLHTLLSNLPPGSARLEDDLPTPLPSSSSFQDAHVALLDYQTPLEEEDLATLLPYHSRSHNQDSPGPLLVTYQPPLEGDLAASPGSYSRPRRSHSLEFLAV